jgi:hypothetical protein
MNERDKNGIEEAMKRQQPRCPHKTHGQKLCAGCATAAAIYYIERYLEPDAAALRGLVRELAYWVRLYAPPRTHRARCDCRTCTALTRADALAGEPGEGGERSAERAAFVACLSFLATEGWIAYPVEVGQGPDPRAVADLREYVNAEALRLYPDVPPAPKAGEEGRAPC